MNLSELEQQRVRKRLDAWCRRRNAALNDGPRWCLSGEGGEFTIRECCGGERLLRLCFSSGSWRLFVPRADSGWLPYPARPEVASVDAVIDELEQAPLHIHW